MAAKPTFLLFILLVTSACYPPDANQPATAGFVCEVMGEAFCARYDECYPESHWEDPGCLQGWMDLCCGDICNVLATRTTTWAYDCADGIQAETCGWFIEPGAIFPETCRI